MLTFIITGIPERGEEKREKGGKRPTGVPGLGLRTDKEEDRNENGCRLLTREKIVLNRKKGIHKERKNRVSRGPQTHLKNFLNSGTWRHEEKGSLQLWCIGREKRRGGKHQDDPKPKIFSCGDKRGGSWGTWEDYAEETGKKERSAALPRKGEKKKALDIQGKGPARGGRRGKHRAEGLS